MGLVLLMGLFLILRKMFEKINLYFKNIYFNVNVYNKANLLKQMLVLLM